MINEDRTAQCLGAQLSCGLRYKGLTLLDARGFSTRLTACEVGPCVSGHTRHSVVTQRPHLQGVPTSWRRQNHINEQIEVNESCAGLPGGSVVKNHLPVQETHEIRVRSLSREDPLEEETAPHSTILAWRIPWTEKAGVAPVPAVTQNRTRLCD